MVAFSPKQQPIIDKVLSMPTNNTLPILFISNLSTCQNCQVVGGTLKSFIQICKAYGLDQQSSNIIVWSSIVFQFSFFHFGSLWFFLLQSFTRGEEEEFAFLLWTLKFFYFDILNFQSFWIFFLSFWGYLIVVWSFTRGEKGCLVFYLWPLKVFYFAILKFWSFSIFFLSFWGLL